MTALLSASVQLRLIGDVKDGFADGDVRVP